MCGFTVAPLVGAWIEISILLSTFVNGVVAPLVGAWIEIDALWLPTLSLLVAPLVGAWIEIAIPTVRYPNFQSLPLWERGLK